MMEPKILITFQVVEKINFHLLKIMPLKKGTFIQYSSFFGSNSKCLPLHTLSFILAGGGEEREN